MLNLNHLTEMDNDKYSSYFAQPMETAHWKWGTKDEELTSRKFKDKCTLKRRFPESTKPDDREP
jgi:hypothetical protein